MAIQSESVLCRRLAEVYLDAVLRGKDKITMQVDWIADILDYLDPENAKTDKIQKGYLDDAEPGTIRKFLDMKEDENGNTVE